MAELLRTEAICKTFGQHQAIDQVSFSLEQGSILGLLGPNGAGKTTLIRLITQIVLPDSGQIWYKGASLIEAHRYQMGYLPEERGLYRKMRVKEQLVYFARLRGVSSKTATLHVNEWCERLGISSLQDYVLETLSKGQQQKVQFISSVVHNPELLILDEPFSGFDPSNAALIKHEMLRLQAAGATIIYSTHRMDTVEGLCTELMLMDHAKIVLKGKPEAIRRQFDKGHVRIKYTGEIPVSYQSLVLKMNTLQDHSHELWLQSHEDKQGMLRAFVDAGIVHAFEEHLPEMEDIFLHLVKEKHL